MKKNITINLFGTLYHIDEDAYELLDKYQKNMHRFFARQEGGEEIADDIEHRVAELFAELKASGVDAVTIEHVQNIMQQIGSPEQMSDEEDLQGQTTPPPAPPREVAAKKRLFRDGEDKMLGGVIGGICRYFGATDSLPWRVLFIVACLFSYSGLFWVYLILWALIPEALTPEERLLMQGKPVNTTSINEELVRGIKKAKGQLTSEETKSTMHGCVNGCLSVFLLIFKILIVLALLGTALTAIIFVIGAAATFWPDTGFADWTPWARITEAGIGETSVKWLLLAMCITGFGIVTLPAYLIIRGLFGRKVKEDEKPRSSAAAWIVWLCMLVAFFVLVPLTVHKYNRVVDTYYEKVNTKDGITLYDGNWEKLESFGFTLSYLENASNRLIGYDDNPRSGENTALLRLKGSNDGQNIPLFTLNHEAELRPGHYRVEMLYRSFDHKESQLRLALPGTADTLTFKLQCDAPKTHFADYTWKEAASRPALSRDVKEAEWATVQQRADSLGWSYNAFDFEVKTPGKATILLQQDSEFALSPMATTHFNVIDFRVLKTDED